MDFHRWMMASRKSGLFTFEFDLEALVQVQPDADTDRDLRELWSLRERGTADVDLRWERHTLANLITRHFYDLALVATGKRNLDVNDLVRKVRLLNALFRMSFRKPSETGLTSAERTLIISHIQESLAHVRRRVAPDGGLRPDDAESVTEDLVEITRRINEYLRRRQDHDEL
ncbi:hypothetical protein AAVH_08838 [Aphelenchoides avenae]|nr:hypothetical protein AAVH_08838 [Aphelenchus avenae]